MRRTGVKVVDQVETLKTGILDQFKPFKSKDMRRSEKTGDVQPFMLSVFATDLGWMGAVGRNEKVIATYVGFPSQKSVTSAVRQLARNFEMKDWDPSLRKKMEAYSKGNVVDFSDVEIDIDVKTGFRLKVILETRCLAYGETVSYGELATRVGHPRAYRAVGTVMSSNRFPLIIPCHRVLAAGGKLGGYSSPSGTNLKLKLLELEMRSSSQR